MCTGIEIAMLVGTAVSVVGQVQQGRQNREMRDTQARQAEQEGAYRMDAAKAQADRIRRAGRAQIGEANAALAASGVKLGEGTPLEVQQSIKERSEQDALTAILNGNRAMSSAEQESNLLRTAGRNEVANSYYGSASTALSAGASYSRWRSRSGNSGNIE